MDQDSTISESNALVAELLRRLERGDVAAFERFLNRNPQLAAELHAFLSARQSAEFDDDPQRLFFFEGDNCEDDESSRLLPPTRFYVPQSQELANESIPLGRIGEYELLEKLAQGGMGIVYKARQASLNRVVAIKTIRHGRLTTANEIARFRREAHASAVLQHPNIVPVYEYGVDDGQHYFTMEFVEGASLVELLREGPLDATTAAEYLKTIARTVEYAHSRGIIHRDLKPSNVLVAAGKHLRITDFGVAKTVGGDGTLSGLGQIVGTPSYMSPEQSLGADGAASPSADIYSLGALLYALLTARPPFLAATEVDTLIQVRTQEPVAPRSLNPDIPPDLEIICLKCLRKEPQQRYATAAALADDLERYLQGKPIVARPISRAERLMRLCRRNPGVAWMAVGSAIVALLLVVALTRANLRLNWLNVELNETIHELDRSSLITRAALTGAEINESKAAQLLYVSDIKEAARAWRDGDARKMIEHLERQRPLSGKRDYRGGEWYFLWDHARNSYDTIIENERPLYFVGFSPDGRRIATAGQDAVIRILNATNYQLEMAIESGQVEVNGVAFSADSNTLASAGDDGTVRLWSLDWQRGAAQVTRTIPAHENQVYDVAFALDGKTLISSGRDSVIRMWDPESGRLQKALEGHKSTVAGISVSTDGRTLASASHDGGIFLWDLSTQSLLRSFDANSGRLTSVSLSHDGRSLVISSIGRKVQVWSVETGKLQHEFEHLDSVERSLFTPDGTAVVACDHGGMIRVWQLSKAEGGRPFSPGIPDLAVWKAHRDRIYTLAIAPDGRRVLSAGADGKVSAWNIAQEPQYLEVQTGSADVVDMAFVPGQNLLATIDGRAVDLWDPETGKLAKRLWEIEGGLRCLAVSADGTTLATGGTAGQIDVGNLAAGGTKSRTTLRPNFSVDQIALSPDGATLAAIERHDTDGDDLYVFDVKSGRRLEAIVSASCNSAAFSPDGRFLITSGPTNVVAVWDLKTQQKIAEQSAHVSSINRIQFSANGRWVATGSDDRLMKVWEASTWKPATTLAGHLNTVESIAFAPDGQTLASAGSDGCVRFWNLAIGREMFDLKTFPVVPEHLAFSPDARLLACLFSNPGPPVPRQSVYILKWRGNEP